MHFLNSHALWLLVLLPVGVYAAWFAAMQKYTALRRYGEDRLLSKSSNATVGVKPVIRRVALATLGLLCGIAALARPALDNGHNEFPQGTVDVIAVVDVSRSMATDDYGKQTRLDMARELLLGEVVASLSANRLGIVSYAGAPNSQAFLTDDLPALSFVLKRALTIESAPGEGSRMAWALARACRLFDLDSPDTHTRVLVLFSDGGSDDKAGQLQYSIRELRKRNVQVVVVGLGGTQARPILSKNLPEHDQKKNGGKWYEVNGKPVKSALDEKLLRSLARQAEGSYVRVESAGDFHLTGMVGGVETRYRRGVQELYVWPLLGALLAFAGLVLMERSLKSRQALQSSAPTPTGKVRSDPGGRTGRSARTPTGMMVSGMVMLLCLSNAAYAAGPAVQGHVRRDFGYRIGDRVEVTYTITLPEGAQLMPDTLQLAGDFEARDTVVQSNGSTVTVRLSLQSFAALPRWTCSGSVAYRQRGDRAEHELTLPPVVVHTSRTWDGREQLQGLRWDQLPVQHWPVTIGLLLLGLTVGGACGYKLSQLRRAVPETPESRKARLQREFFSAFNKLDTDHEAALRGLCYAIREWYGMPALPMKFVPIQVSEANDQGVVTTALNAVETALFSGSELQASGRDRVTACATKMFGTASKPQEATA